jgi:[ribosomal protein S5]-alanine N-acetyltransferase
MPPNLQPARELLYEPLAECHAAQLFEIFQDLRTYDYIDEKPTLTLEAMERQCRAFSTGAPADSGETWLNWAIRDPITLRCVGTLQATAYADGRLWVGYKIAPALWGRGYGTQAVRWLLTDLGERFPGVEALASVDTRNLGSIRLLERCGFAVIRTEPAELHGVATEDFIYVHRAVG